jgi:hypothetical protein
MLSLCWILDRCGSSDLGVGVLSGAKTQSPSIHLGLAWSHVVSHVGSTCCCDVTYHSQTRFFWENSSLWSSHYGWVISFELLTSVTVLSRIFGLNDLMRATRHTRKGKPIEYLIRLSRPIIRLRMTSLEFTCEGRGLVPTGTGFVGDSLMVTLVRFVIWVLFISWIYGYLFLTRRSSIRGFYWRVPFISDPPG